MRLQFKYLSIVAASAMLIGCGGGGGGGNNSTPPITSNPPPPPSLNDTEAPNITTTSAYITTENKKYISFVAADDASEVSYSITGGVDKDKFSIDSHDGTLIFKNTPDFENPADADANNIYEVTIEATDTSGNKASKDITITVKDKNESIPKSYELKPLKNGSNSYDAGTTPKDLYILFTNTSKNTDSTPSVTHNQKNVPERENRTISSLKLFEQPQILHAPAYIQEFNSKIKTFLHKNSNNEYKAKNIAVTSATKLNKSVGDSETFYMDASSSGTTTRATLKKVVSNVSTAFGNKTLNVWVSDDSFGTGCVKSRCVTQTMVDALADNFLKVGSDNDIYDWVTNIFGEEWGSDASSKDSDLIGSNDEITILLTDIGNDDSPSGGTIGYFWSKDNFNSSSISGSNERIMFYADAVMFANTDNGDFWQKEMYSTLAHEFQHMIHFYQKTVLLDASDDTWINEMLSETTEDLIATKIQHTGPRGVVYTEGSAGSAGNINGRYPLFNENNTLSLTAWNNSLADYSKVNAFGTFLTRNYGGAKVLHDIMANGKLHEDAIEEATGKTFGELLKEWGIAVMLSDRADAARDQYSYNIKDFTVNEESGIIYKMGAINFFNYDPKPNISTNIGTVKPQGNYYYEVGTGLTGIVNIDLTLDANTEATLIVK